MAKARKNRKASGITLKDVMVHMRGMEQRLSDKIEENTRGIENCNRNIAENTQGIAQNSAEIRELRVHIDALDEDLTATIKDTIKIREHVGMTKPDE